VWRQRLARKAHSYPSLGARDAVHRGRKRIGCCLRSAGRPLVTVGSLGQALRARVKRLRRAASGPITISTRASAGARHTEVT